MVSATIINELGNKIDISVGQSEDGREITLTMIGPTSMSENIVTRLEAETLYRLLGAALASSR